jgi:uncharacterized RDD family membrane protein YckC
MSLILASWGERLVAYIIDVVILGLVVGWFSLPSLRWMPSMLGTSFPDWIPFVDIGFRNVIYFLYWFFMEQAYCQSLGKMFMKIEVRDLEGGPIDFNQAAVEAVGKAFLLPLDLILGLVLYPARRQRLFNQLSDTIVLKKLG